MSNWMKVPHTQSFHCELGLTAKNQMPCFVNLCTLHKRVPIKSKSVKMHFKCAFCFMWASLITIATNVGSSVCCQSTNIECPNLNAKVGRNNATRKKNHLAWTSQMAMHVSYLMDLTCLRPHQHVVHLIGAIVTWPQAAAKTVVLVVSPPAWTDTHSNIKMKERQSGGTNKNDGFCLS